MGGYAGSITDLVLRVAAKAPDVVRLDAVCDPSPALFPDKLARLGGLGVSVSDSFDKLLATDVEAVWLPVPIDLHRPFAEKAFAAGKAVMCEKPPAGSVQDLDAMDAAATSAGKALLFGFQDMYDPATLDLKRQLLQGLIGTIDRASVMACWPRDRKYYERNTWAGKLKRNGVWVMDSPVMNALAHPVNQTLYLLGATEPASAGVRHVRAELYRANPIENFDTCAIGATLDRDIRLTVALTHACTENFGPIVSIHGSRGWIEMSFGEVSIHVDGKTTKSPRNYADKLEQMVHTLSDVMRGRTRKTAAATAEVARPHLVLVNAASACVAVTTVGGADVKIVQNAETQTLTTIPGIESLVRAAAEWGQLFHESGQARWTQPAGSIDTTTYRHFDGPRV
jgi:predicted dehydrogenase